jgi:thiol:disulfide interchange protein
MGIGFFTISVLALVLYLVGRFLGFHAIDNLLELLMLYFIFWASLEVAGREDNGKMFIVYSMFVGIDFG